MKTFILGLFNNLYLGLRLALPVRVYRMGFEVSHAQFLLLLCIVLLLDVGNDWFQAQPKREFNLYGISYLSTLYLAWILSLYLMALIHRQGSRWLDLAVLSTASSPLFVLIDYLTMVYLDEYLTTSNPVYNIVYLIVFVWLIAVTIRILRLCFYTNWQKLTASVALVVALTIASIIAIPEQPLWYGNVDYDATKDVETINVEDTFYQQYPLMDDALHHVQASDPDKTELYMLGFSPYSSQDVFIRESRYVEAYMDEHFDTIDRSLFLINHRDTYKKQPLANGHNLTHALNVFADKMGDEDILFLFMTSHGSKKHELAVNFWPLRLNNLPASKLYDLLDQSSIRWRVIFISACYSGGFIEQLKNPNTLIMTAAASDKKSFGCSHESKSTWFTDAYFNQALPKTNHFLTAFDQARVYIQEKEKQEKKTPSEPQIYVGEEIRTKLEQWHKNTRGAQHAAAD